MARPNNLDLGELDLDDLYGHMEEVREQTMDEYIRELEMEFNAPIATKAAIIDNAKADVDESWNALMATLGAEEKWIEPVFRPTGRLDTVRPGFRTFKPGVAMYHGGYRRRPYHLVEGAPSEREVAQAIVDARESLKAVGVPADHIGRATVHFQLEGSQPQQRQIEGDTVDEILAAIQFRELGLTEMHGSNAVYPDSELVLTDFSIGWWDPLKGKGRKGFYSVGSTRYYAYRDFTQSGNCLIDTMRGISPVKVSKRSATLMKEAWLEADSALGPSAMDWLEPIFGVSMAIWDGDEIEAVIEVKDTPKLNRCIVERKPVVLRPANPAYPAAAEGLAILLIKNEEGEGHYVLATKEKEVIFHQVTGKEIVGGVQPSTAQIWKELGEQNRGVRSATGGNGVNKVRGHRYKKRVLCYDLETVFQADTGILVPYACAWIVFDPDKPPANFDSEEVRAQLNIEITDKPGKVNPIEALLDFIEQAPLDEQYVIQAYNGARFDHMMLAREATRRGQFKRLIWFGGAIYGGAIGRHTFHDLCRFTACSLAKACKDFKTSPAKIAGFAHEIPQEEFLRDRFPQWIRAKSGELRKYIANDVLALADLFVKVRAAFEQLKPDNAPSNYDILGFMTIGSLAWDAWSATQPATSQRAPATRELDQQMRRGLTAGRVEVLGDGKPKKLEGQLRMVDFKSLYPTVCLKNAFPIGACRAVDEEEEGKIGIYNCTIISQPIDKPNIIPLRPRNEKGRQIAPLDWKFKGRHECMLTTVDIAEVRRIGGEIVVGAGYVWDESDENLFRDYYDLPAGEKNRQDKLKNDKSPEYNPALREVCKLMMNSLTGKVAQRERLTTCRIVKGHSKQIAFRSTLVPGTIEEEPLYGETMIISGVVRDKPYNPKRAKPSFLACFIYSYARRELYKLLKYSHYCDTDSGLMWEHDYELCRKECSALFPLEGEEPVFGQVDEELARYKAASYRAYLIQPKTYAVFLLDKEGAYLRGKEGEILSKIKGKGISKNDLVIGEEDAKLIKEGGRSPGEMFFIVKDYAEVDGLQFGKEENAERFYDSLKETGKAYTVGSQLLRKKGSAGQPFVISQRFPLKEHRPCVEATPAAADDNEDPDEDEE